MRLLERCAELLDAFPQHVVAGVGDVMLDQYRRGVAQGLSPEAPVPDLLNPDLRETPGGAANVAWNIGHLGGQVRMVGVVGKDAAGATLRALLQQSPGVTPVFVEDSARHTTVKRRYYHQQFQLLRVSEESKESLSVSTDAAVRAAVGRAVAGAAALFVEDYGKHVVSPALVSTLLEIRAQHPTLPLVLDPKTGNHDVYQPGMCTVLKPNWKEACQLVGVVRHEAQRDQVVRRLSRQYDCDVLVTLGADGVVVVRRGSEVVFHVPARAPRAAFDIAGAGDTVLAVTTLVLAAGGSLIEAALLSNLAAGIVVEKTGTAFVTPAELAAELLHPAVQALVVQMEATAGVSA